MRRYLASALAAMAIGAAACATNPRSVPVSASPADWEALAGGWRGSYTTSEPTRRGLIDFTLSSSGVRAFGDVLMIADGSRIPYRAYPPGDPRLAPVETAYTQLLTITFVRAEGGQISGTIASYWDPDRSCQASATFVGTAKSHTIDGTFTSTCEDGVRQLRGKWRVTRQASPSR